MSRAMYPVDERHRWSYPSKETLSSFLSNKGLSREVLERCTVRELILNGNQSEEVVIEWHHDRMTEDKTSFPNSPLSLDVEQVRCMLLTVLRMGGQEPQQGKTMQLSDRPHTHGGPATAR